MSLDKGRGTNGWGCELDGGICVTHSVNEYCPTTGTGGLPPAKKTRKMYNVTLSVSVEDINLATEALIKLNNVMSQMMRDTELAGDKSMYTGIHATTEEVDDDN